jgi:hypothetical protein
VAHAPPKWSKRWTDIPRATDRVGAYSTEQLEQMNREFTAAVERAFRAGGESEMAAAQHTAFPYPTKISPEAIALFIAAHTQPGDTVYQCPPPRLGDPQ